MVTTNSNFSFGFNHLYLSSFCSYQILNPKAVATIKDEKVMAQTVLEGTGLDAEQYRLGHTKVYKMNLCPLKLQIFFKHGMVF